MVTIDSVLHNPVLCSEMRAFLGRNFAQENIDFLVAVRGFKRGSRRSTWPPELLRSPATAPPPFLEDGALPTVIPQTGQEIYRLYWPVLNLSSRAQRHTKERADRLEFGDPSLFDEAEQEVKKLLESEWLPKYVSSSKLMLRHGKQVQSVVLPPLPPRPRRNSSVKVS